MSAEISADGVGDGGVGIKAVVDDAAVDRNDVAGAEEAFLGRDAVHHLVIDGGAERGRVAVVSLERGDDAGELGHLLVCGDLEIHRGGAGPNGRGDGLVDLAEDAARGAHLLDLRRRFDHDGHLAGDLCGGGQRVGAEFVEAPDDTGLNLLE